MGKVRSNQNLILKKVIKSIVRQKVPRTLRGAAQHHTNLIGANFADLLSLLSSV